MVLFLLICVLTCTVGQKIEKGTMSNILAELKNLQEAQKEYSNSLSELHEFKARILSLENTVKDLQDTVKDLQRENKELVSTIHQHERHFRQNTNVNGYKSKTDGQGISGTHKRDEVLNATFLLQESLKEGEKTIRHDQRIRQVANAHVAFTAGLSAHTSVGEHHTIIYDNAITNIGNAYHPNIGIFFAPVKGAYVFSTLMMLFSGEGLYLEIVVDGTFVNYIYADSRPSSLYVSSTKEWILEVNKGSEVWIRSRGQGRLHGGSHCIFSGFLLFEME